MSSAAGATFQDRTFNKVAVCSAVFAGFAYVGYSYAKTAFCRKLGRRQGPYHDDDNQTVSRVVFRRLSQTSNADCLMGNLDENTGGKFCIRPKSVQARIRELNLRARQFSDTFVAIQNNGGLGGPCLSRAHAVYKHQSLQCSPWASPRLLSPVDIRGLTSSHSTENLSRLPSTTSPKEPNWVRRSLRRKKLRSDNTPPPSIDGSDEKMEIELDDENEMQRRARMERETRDMYSSNKEQLIERLKGLTNRGRLLSPFEAKTLVALLCAEDTGLLERTLVTIANCATFTLNVDLLRESGCIIRLADLLTQPDERIKLAAVQTLGNVLLAEESITQAQSCLDPLFENIFYCLADNPLCLASLVVLTNIATVPTWHDTMGQLLDRLYELVSTGQPQVQLQSLRLLVNLSCNKEMMPRLLSSQCPECITDLMLISTDRGVLLRILTLLSALSSYAADNKLSIDTALENQQVTNKSMFFQMMSSNVRQHILTESDNIRRYHTDPEVRRQAARLHSAMAATVP